MKHLHLICTLLFGVAVFLFFGLAYPHHLHYQEQYQLFLFDSTYVWEIVSLPGGISDLLGRFCTQFFLFAWVGAFIIALLLSAVQLLTFRLINVQWSYGLTFVPSFLLWLFMLDENALMSGIWAILLTLLVACVIVRQTTGWTRRALLIVAIPILYLLALWIMGMVLRRTKQQSRALYDTIPKGNWIIGTIPVILVAIVMGSLIWKNSNFKAEKVMQYDFMACHQQWNRILETINVEKPNNQIGVTVQNLALAMHGVLLEHMSEYNQNGIAGLLPDVKEDATSPLPTAEAFYQLGMVNVAQRTVFEAQEAILDFQKSGGGPQISLGSPKNPLLS